MERLLNAAGFHAVTFSSAEALLVSGAAAEADCLVLDVHLPGLSGFELCHRLAQGGQRQPVIFVTAFDDPASQAQAHEAGALAYFTKPFPGQKLLGAIARALGSSGTEDGRGEEQIDESIVVKAGTHLGGKAEGR